jgi:hypothetical protein
MIERRTLGLDARRTQAGRPSARRGVCGEGMGLDESESGDGCKGCNPECSRRKGDSTCVHAP